MTDNKMKPHILVTGGAGFIGSHTCMALHQAGFVPVSYDSLVRGNESFCKWGPLIKGDVRDTTQLVRVLKDYKIQSVIHFAAFAYVGESVEKPGLYYENNVVGTLSLLQACQQTGVKNLIFSSSCATYGVPEKMPITEETSQNPVNPYGRTKKIGEDMIADFQKVTGMNAVCLRYFNAAGSDPEMRVGESHDPETHLIPNVLLAALHKNRELKIFGQDYPTPDGTCVRDYLHVCDLAKAHVDCLLAFLKGQSLPFAMNLGTGNGHSVKQVLDMCREVTGLDIPYSVSPRRAGDPPELVASAELAKKHIHFTAQFTLRDSIEHAYRWLKKSKPD